MSSVLSRVWVVVVVVVVVLIGIAIPNDAFTMPVRMSPTPSSSSTTILQQSAISAGGPRRVRVHWDKNNNNNKRTAESQRTFHQQQWTRDNPRTSSSSSDPKSVVVQKQHVDKKQDEEKSTVGVASATFSLIKALLGSGMLALPAGLSAVTNYKSPALQVANLFLAVLTVLSAYTYALYGRLVHRTKATSLGDLWDHYFGLSRGINGDQQASNRRRGISAVSMATFVYCFGICLTFSLIIGDSVKSILQAGGITSGLLSHRQTSILGVMAAMVFPLCNLSSLAALAPVSILGVIGTILTTTFMGWRCPALFPNSPYNVAATAAATATPIFDTYQRVASPAPLLLIAMSGVALMGHFSAPDFYHAFCPNKSDDQKQASDQPIQQQQQVLAATTEEQSQQQETKKSMDSSVAAYNDSKKERPLRNFIITTVLSYTSVMILNGLALTFGFLTFGGSCKGMILNNYASNDPGAFISRCLIAVSVIGSYPFLLRPCKTTILDYLRSKNDNKSAATTVPSGSNNRRQEFKVTAGLLSVLTAIACVVKDAGFVVSFNGALMGASIIYILPAILFLKEQRQQQEQGQIQSVGAARMATTSRRSLFRQWTKQRAIQSFEKWLCRFLIGFGVLSASIGAITSIIVSYFPHLIA